MERAHRSEIAGLLGSEVVDFGVTQAQSHASQYNCGQANAGKGRSKESGNEGLEPTRRWGRSFTPIQATPNTFLKPGRQSWGRMRGPEQRSQFGVRSGFS